MPAISITHAHEAGLRALQINLKREAYKGELIEFVPVIVGFYLAGESLSRIVDLLSFTRSFSGGFAPLFDHNKIRYVLQRLGYISPPKPPDRAQSRAVKKFLRAKQLLRPSDPGGRRNVWQHWTPEQQFSEMRRH